MRGGASRTAEVVCWIRALERRRPRPVVDDPFAEGFLRAPLRWALRGWRVWAPLSRGWPGLSAYIAGRHRWMDDHLERAKASGASQVLVLGAGYDSRSLRFPGVPYWEVDHPATAKRKRRLARRRGLWTAETAPRQVEVDFGRQDLAARLLEEGFEPGVPTFVIWEGVTMYLTRAAVLETLRTLNALLGPGSALVFDAYCVPDGHDLASDLLRLSPTLMPLLGEPVSFFLHPDDLGSLLQGTAWEVGEVLTASAMQATFSPHRVVYPPCYLAHLLLPGESKA